MKCKGKSCEEIVCEKSELRCPGKGATTPPKCLPLNYMCDGTPDCWDGPDEKNCSKCHINVPV